MLVAIGILIGLIVGRCRVRSRSGARQVAPRRRRAAAQADARRGDARGGHAPPRGADQRARGGRPLRAEIDQEVAEHRSRIVKVEERVLAKEEEIDAKLTELAPRAGLSDRETHLKQLQEEQKRRASSSSPSSSASPA
jgi:hypothetical protein